LRELTRPLHDEAQGSFHNDTDVEPDVSRRELAAAAATRDLARLDLSSNATSTLSQSGSGASSRSSVRNTGGYFDPSSEYLRGVRVEEETCLYNWTYEELSRIAGASAYVSLRQHTLAYVSIRWHTSAYVSIRQHTSACDSICLEEAEEMYK
jgi:hypothetical protein